ncbi:hypothetical protein [Algoriphagus persicinus]|uniref:hypothetical protein n=1 Tax=Algoriphagus persicinus TaxID=3108754 RepID=UPI002B370F1D|nr:hypothetical protein [Algoriphagus sp. E1-3-M2]MEB2787372.1 hypothetical protein [Algoriphagus sp. E1-3-M2]
MKNFATVFGLSVILMVSPLMSCAQKSAMNLEDMFTQIRKNIQPIVLHHPRGISENKYVAFSFEVDFGENVVVTFSDNTPENIKSRKKDAEARIKSLLLEKGILFEEPWHVFYPVLLVWEDNRVRVDNLNEELTNLMGTNNYKNIRNLRIEKVILNPLLGSVD